MLRQQGRQVLVLEREQFPRFSIGESLLPQSMEYLEQAGMLAAVQQAGFQLKNGAAFARGDQFTEFNLAINTHRVEHDLSGRMLVDHLWRSKLSVWAEVRYRHQVTAVDLNGGRPRVTVKDPQDHEYFVDAAFILDASGFGRAAATVATGNAVEFAVRGRFSPMLKTVSRGPNSIATRFA